MFIGHLAVGFATTRWDPRLRLGDALVAAQLPDVIWPCLVLAGIERVVIAPGDTVVTPLRFESYPISHSLLMVVVWGMLLALFGFRRHGSVRTAAILGLLAVSHWLLDFVSHRPDMPLFPGASPRFGLGLWNSQPGTLLVEGALFAGGVWAYVGSRRAARRARSALASFVTALALLYLANVFSPPPPSVRAVALSSALLAPILWAWANWVDSRSGDPIG